MNSKEYFFNEVIKEALLQAGNSLRVLELGCGTAAYVPAMIKKYPQLEYVGIEPIETSFKKAQANLHGVPHTKISSQLGYDAISDADEHSFDIVISFSVLEHVKHLDKFMKLSARYAKIDALIVHRYDLGHALYPVSLKERLHLFLGNNIPTILPERTFVRYVPMIEVEKYCLNFFGASPYKYTYHQMPNHKELIKRLPQDQEIDASVMDEVYAWEFTHADIFHKIPTDSRERLFPTVAVWSKMKKEFNFEA